MRIGLAQIFCRPGDVAFNTRTIASQIREAAARGCDVVALPEMSDTGYHMPTIVRTASTWDGGVFREVAAVAAETRITVVIGLSERVDDDVYNTVAVLGPDGELIAKYRKTHLITAEPVCEQNTIRPGDALVLCDIAGFRAGFLTCYDIRFPELARKLALGGAEILFIPAAFPVARIMHWNALAVGRAIENQVYVAAVNRVGTDERLTFGGSSRLLDPFGTLLASASEADETMLVGEVTRERLTEV
ncbi:MAG TPA: nitrilase-related carbon-nitrogen hydrolase, partial [Gemmataceae bacterium]|nr:nitrilase-related carbon-nitrogen hydrolase [Gemmataceae bacterium]